MNRRVFFILAIVGGLLIVLTLIFFVFNNFYSRVNPPAPQNLTAGEEAPAPSSLEEPKAELLKIWEGPILGATTGIDGVRLVFMDKERAIIKVLEFDGSGEQKLSDVFAGVNDFAVSPTKDIAWIQINDPDTSDLITLIYNFRTRESTRLENGIGAIDFSPDGQQLVYYVVPTKGVPQIKTVGLTGDNPQVIKNNFVLLDPVLDWYAPDRIAFWLKPASTRPSAIISMNSQGQETVELFASNFAIQAKFSPDGKNALVSFNNPATKKPVLSMLDTETKNITTVSLKTWADKCDWAADSSLAVCFEPSSLPGGFVFPDKDDGSLDYQDRLWSIVAATQKPSRIYDVPSNIKDARMPILAGDSKRLTFLDRLTEQLLSLDLSDKLFPVTPKKNQESASGQTTGSIAPPLGSTNNNR